MAKFDNLGTNLIYLTYLGGSGDDAAYGLAVDGAGDAYVDRRHRLDGFSDQERDLQNQQQFFRFRTRVIPPTPLSRN